MERVYIFSSGKLKRKDNTLCFESQEDKRFIPVEDVKEIYLFGEVDLNSRVLNFLSQKGVLLHLFNRYGFYSGSFLPRKKNVSGYLLVKQVQHYINGDGRLFLASSFVDGAVFHIKRNLKKRGIEIEEIEKLESRIFTVETVAELMQLEGKIREIYYSKFSKILKKAFPFALATALISPLYPAKENKANAIELISVGYSFLDKQTQTTSSNNSNLYKQKKQEFKPPELPYCRIKRADWEGVVIDYWDKWGEKHTYSWVVERPFWYSDTGASVDLVYPYRIQNAGDRDFDGLEECLVRAGKKALKSKYYGGSATLYLDEIDGYPFDKITIYYTTTDRLFLIQRMSLLQNKIHQPNLSVANSTLVAKLY